MIFVYSVESVVVYVAKNPTIEAVFEHIRGKLSLSALDRNGSTLIVFETAARPSMKGKDRLRYPSIGEEISRIFRFQFAIFIHTLEYKAYRDKSMIRFVGITGIR